MHYSEVALRKMAQDAGQQFLVGGASLTDSIEKIAYSRGLNQEQIARVCAFANHTVNAEMMTKKAYTSFEIADPRNIQPRGIKESGFLPVPCVASVEAEPEQTKIATNSVLETFVDIANAYGVQTKFIGDDDYDIRSLLKSADILSQKALENLEKVATESSKEGAKFYNDFRAALLNGVPLSKLISDAKAGGMERQLQQIWPRLQAEKLVAPPHFDDAGPYSLQRAYKQAEADASMKSASLTEWEMDGDYADTADRIAQLEDQALMDIGTVVFCAKTASVYANEPFVQGPYRDMVNEMEKRALRAIDRAVVKGLGKLVAAPFKGIHKGIKSGLSGMKDHRNAVNAWKQLSPSQRALTPKPTTKMMSAGKFIVKHPIPVVAGAFAAPEVVGALSEVNAKPRLVPV